jgi:hypothetical protein
MINDCCNLQKLCYLVSRILIEESNVQPVSSPVTICGDIHGQVMRIKDYARLKRMWIIAGLSVFVGLCIVLRSGRVISDWWRSAGDEVYFSRGLCGPWVLLTGDVH